MTKLNVQQLNAVWEQINEIAKNYTQFDVLRNHVVAITSELVSRKAFVFEDDQWALSDREWADWIVSGEGKKYLDSSPGESPGASKLPSGLTTYSLWRSSLSLGSSQMQLHWHNSMSGPVGGYF